MGKLQLVGVTAMFIASKVEEMYAPEINDFVYITDNAYTAVEIRQMELRVPNVGVLFHLLDQADHPRGVQAGGYPHQEGRQQDEGSSCQVHEQEVHEGW